MSWRELLTKFGRTDVPPPAREPGKSPLNADEIEFLKVLLNNTAFVDVITKIVNYEVFSQQELMLSVLLDPVGLPNVAMQAATASQTLLDFLSILRKHKDFKPRP